MIELTGFALAVLVLGILLIPRTTFFVTWFFNVSAVAAVLGGNAVILTIFGVMFLPKVTMAYFLLEAAAGAPASGTFLYWAYLGLALFFDLGSKTAINNQRD